MYVGPLFVCGPFFLRIGKLFRGGGGEREKKRKKKIEKERESRTGACASLRRFYIPWDPLYRIEYSAKRLPPPRSMRISLVYFDASPFRPARARSSPFENLPARR